MLLSDAIPKPESNMSKRMKSMIVLLLAGALVALAGCEKKEEATGESGEKTAEAAPEETEDEAEVEELVFAFQPQANPEAITPDAEKLAAHLSKEIGVEAKVFMPTNYAGVVEALRAGNADVAYFSGWPYLVAHKEAGAELVVVEERDGKPFYHSQWYVLKDGGIKSLADLKGKDIAFTSPTSTSGYLFPLAKVIEEGLVEKQGDPKSFFGEVLYAGGYEQALKALVNGKVAAAAASDYAFDRYLNDEERAKVEVLTKQGPVPTHGIAVRGELSDEMKAKVKNALLTLNKPENKELLKSVYGAEKLVARTHDEHVGALSKALELVGDKKDEKSADKQAETNK